MEMRQVNNERAVLDNWLPEARQFDAAYQQATLYWLRAPLYNHTPVCFLEAAFPELRERWDVQAAAGPSDRRGLVSGTL